MAGGPEQPAAQIEQPHRRQMIPKAGSTPPGLHPRHPPGCGASTAHSDRARRDASGLTVEIRAPGSCVRELNGTDPYCFTILHFPMPEGTTDAPGKGRNRTKRFTYPVLEWRLFQSIPRSAGNLDHAATIQPVRTAAEITMNAKPSSLVASVKILASTMLVTVGAIGLYADFYPTPSKRGWLWPSDTRFDALLLRVDWRISSPVWLCHLYRWLADGGVETTKPVVSSLPGSGRRGEDPHLLTAGPDPSLLCAPDLDVLHKVWNRLASLEGEQLGEAHLRRLLNTSSLTRATDAAFVEPGLVENDPVVQSLHFGMDVADPTSTPQCPRSSWWRG